MHYYVVGSHCGLTLSNEPNNAVFSTLDYMVMEDTATYYYKANERWLGNDTVYFKRYCIRGNAPDHIDTLVLVIHVTESTVGIQDEALSLPEIYPNPARHFIHVQFKHEVPSGFEITVLTLEGVVLRKEKNKGRISVAGLNPGLYLIKLEYGKERVIRKVLVGGG